MKECVCSLFGFFRLESKNLIGEKGWEFGYVFEDIGEIYWYYVMGRGKILVC